MTAPGIEVSAMELLELDTDWAVPCECTGEHGCGGDNAAEWIAYWVDCCPRPKRFLYCTPCKDLLAGAPAVTCSWCHEMFEPGSTAFALIEPLNPGRG